MKNSTINYKPFILPLVFLVSSVFIFMEVFLPSFGNLGSLREDLNAQEKKLGNFRNSVNTLKSLNENTVSDELEVASKALPTAKNLQDIYLALTDAALKSNVNLKGFTVKAGEVYGKSGKSAQTSANGIPTVMVNAQFSGLDNSSIINFAQALKNESPLSRINSIDFQNGQGDMDIEFYYKPYDLSAINSDVVSPVSPSEKKIIEDLSVK